MPFPVQRAGINGTVSRPRDTSHTAEPDTYVLASGAAGQDFFGRGWQPLTIAVWHAIRALPPDVELTPVGLAAWFASLGWKSANGKPLSVAAVRGQLKLIRQAGYLHATRTRGERGRVSGIRYEAFTEPRPVGEIRFADARPGHVSPFAPHGGPEGDGPRPDQVPPITTRGESQPMEPGVKPQVAPHVANDAVPPVPPGGGGNPSPSPQDHQLAEVQEFLADLPGPWACGQVTATRLAPALLRICAQQGWTLGAKLRTKLTENPGGIRSYPKTLRHRIDDLPRHRAATPETPTATPVTDPCPAHPHRETVDCLPCRAGTEPAEPADPTGPVDTADIRAQVRAFLSEGKTQRIATEQRTAGRRRGLEAHHRRQAEEFEANRAQQLTALERLMAQQANPSDVE